jgi:hypothetical protein
VGQGYIGNRNNARAAVDLARIPVTITEGIELLNVVEVEPGLYFDPAPQTAFQAGMIAGLERAVRERHGCRFVRAIRCLVDNKNARRIVRHRNYDGDQVDNGIRS